MLNFNQLLLLFLFLYCSRCFTVSNKKLPKSLVYGILTLLTIYPFFSFPATDTGSVIFFTVFS